MNTSVMNSQPVAPAASKKMPNMNKVESHFRSADEWKSKAEAAYKRAGITRARAEVMRVRAEVLRETAEKAREEAEKAREVAERCALVAVDQYDMANWELRRASDALKEATRG